MKRTAMIFDDRNGEAATIAADTATNSGGQHVRRRDPLLERPA
jgi:hypothetical protein